MARQLITATVYDKRGRFLSQATNSYTKTHPYQAELAASVGLPNKVFLHAEIAALLKCKRLDKAHSIRVERYRRDGSPALAKPCPICEEAIRQAGIQEVTFTIG